MTLVSRDAIGECLGNCRDNLPRDPEASVDAESDS
jgi:hypothetical protein